MNMSWNVLKMLVTIWITTYSSNHHRHLYAGEKSSRMNMSQPFYWAAQRVERMLGLTRTWTMTRRWVLWWGHLGTMKKWSAVRLCARSRKASKSPEEWNHYMCRQRKEWACWDLEGDMCHVAGIEDTGLGLRHRQVVGDEARQASRGESQGWAAGYWHGRGSRLYW